MAENPESGPKVVIAFQDYSPPFDVENCIRRMLRIVPSNYLWGLHSIVLTNVQALSRKERDRKTWGRRHVALREVRGYYTPEWSGAPAHITLLIDNCEKRMGRSWLRVGFIRDMELSELLFHELGHHIHEVHKPKFENKEDVADKWSKRYSKKFLRDRYWYLTPIAIPISFVLR